MNTWDISVYCTNYLCAYVKYIASHVTLEDSITNILRVIGMDVAKENYS